MGLWKITGTGASKVTETHFHHEKLKEEKLEDWIVRNPSILGEPLLMIGRQVLIPDTKDKLDLLAIDPQGTAVVIEIKRGQLKDPVDIQALRYSSYISKWKEDDFERQAKNFLKKGADAEFDFNDHLAAFCEDAGTDEVPHLNGDQRIIIVGSSVRDKLGSVALWLREHSVDIKLIEVQAYKDGDSIYIEPTIIVPPPVRFADVGRPRPESNPWITDGKAWHLEKRCSPKTKEMLLQLARIMQERLQMDEPVWNQKFYISYRVENVNWLNIETRRKSLILGFSVKAKAFQATQLAKTLGIEKYDAEETLSEKFSLPSHVQVKNRSDSKDKVKIHVKEDFKLGSKVFLEFLKAAYKARTK